MSDLRYPKIYIKCKRCDGHKGIYGKSERNYPATLPCPDCDATGEVLLDPALYNPTNG